MSNERILMAEHQGILSTDDVHGFDRLIKEGLNTATGIAKTILLSGIKISVSAITAHVLWQQYSYKLYPL